MQTTALGNTGLRVSRLNFGTGTNGWSRRSDQSDLGVDGLARLLRLAYDLGVNFWDSADQYGTHPHFRQALKGIGRQSVVINTKTTAKGREAETEVHRFLRELGTEYVDVVMLHGVNQRDWPQARAEAVEALTRCKAQGLVKALGVSCHSLDALETAASEPWVDVILARLNSAGANTDAAPERVVPVLKRAHAAGKGVYAMKVLGCGQLTGDVSGCFRYVLGLGCVDAITVGMRSEAELGENVRLVDEITAGATTGSPGNG